MAVLETLAECWQYDLWFQIISAAFGDHPEQVDLAYHPALQLPAMMLRRDDTGTGTMVRAKYNANRSYQDQVKPFNFMCGFTGFPPLSATGEEIGDGA